MTSPLPSPLIASPTPTPSRSGSISPAPEPTDADLHDGRWIDLSRIPASDQAKAMVAEVAALVAPYDDRRRPLGDRGRHTLAAQLGIILAGILRGAFRDHVVSVHSSPKGGVWRNALVGQRGAWGRLGAMERAGLIGVRKGVQTNKIGGDDPIYGGLPTRVWATPRLLDLAAGCGVTAATLASDWTVNPKVERVSIRVTRADLVDVRGLGRGAGRMAVRRDQAAEAEAMRDRLTALNAHVRSVPISGCLPPAFRRVFREDLRLGGRFYAVGGANYQNLPREDRAVLRIGGEAVVEVDLHAAFLTLLLGLGGTQELPADDLYAAVGLPREVTKAWMVQTFATGTPAGRWSRSTPPDVTALNVKATTVRDAALRTYPALRDLRQIVPTDLRSRLPEDKHGWAVGQFLTSLESQVMDSALRYVEVMGVVGLPMHDSIIVPEKAAPVAAEALRGACWAVAHVTPRVKVSAELPVA